MSPAKAAPGAAALRVLAVGSLYPPHHLGGYELTWQGTVEHLRASGHAVTVLTSGRLREGAVDPDPPWVERSLRSYWTDRGFPRLSLRAVVSLERHNDAALARTLEQARPDAVSWWSMGGLSMGLLERVRRPGIPSVGVVGDDWLLYGPEMDRWQRLAARLGAPAALLARVAGLPPRVRMRNAAHWLFGSESTRRRAESVHGPLAGEIVHPGVADDLGDPLPPRPWSWHLLYFGRLDPRKGIDTAIEALAVLPSAATLTIIGGGDDAYAEQLHALAARLRVSERVAFHPQRERAGLRDALAVADAVVFPVRWEEPWGLVPLEAMALGRPVLATSRGGGAEYLRDGENALVFAPDNPDGLAALTRRLAGDPSLREQLVIAGRATAARNTATAFQERVTEALETAASTVGGGAAPSRGA